MSRSRLRTCPEIPDVLAKLKKHGDLDKDPQKDLSDISLVYCQRTQSVLYVPGSGNSALVSLEVVIVSR